MMPEYNMLHSILKEENLTREYISFHQDQLNNQTWLSSILRPINSSEIKLENFVIYAKELNGQENFILLCLNSTIFRSDDKKRKCVQQEIIELPGQSWVLENQFGKFEHYQ